MPKDNHPPAMMLYFKDFFSDGKVEAMSTLELGAYFRLLGKAWFEDPPGTIPNDDRVLARWARLTPDEWAECRPGVLAGFLLCDDNRLHQKRMRKEFGKLMKAAKEKSNNAKRAANARWSEKEYGRNAHALPDDAIPSSSPSAFAIKPSSSSNSNVDPPNGEEDEGFSMSWEDLTARLNLIGVNDARGAIGHARSHDLSRIEVHNLIEHYTSNRGQWPPGGLHWRISNGIHGQPIAEGWPTSASKRVNGAKTQRALSIETIRSRLIMAGVDDARNWNESEIIARAKERNLV